MIRKQVQQQNIVYFENRLQFCHITKNHLF